MRSIEEFLAHFRRQHAWTRRLIAAIPEARFDWAPAPREFTLGGLVRHLIQSEVYWRRMLLAARRGEVLDPFRLVGSGSERLIAFRGKNLESSVNPRYGSTFAECLAAWSGVRAETEREFAAFSPDEIAGLEVYHPLADLRTPLWEMLWTLVEHETHHRGQISAYLKVLGVPQPPIFTG